jgi:carbon storage regulator
MGRLERGRLERGRLEWGQFYGCPHRYERFLDNFYKGELLMLILSRRPGETIIIGTGDYKMEVTVLGINGNQTRIGIKAPPQISVHREEIYKKIQAEKQRAAAGLVEAEFDEVEEE